MGNETDIVEVLRRILDEMNNKSIAREEASKQEMKDFVIATEEASKQEMKGFIQKQIASAVEKLSKIMTNVVLLHMTCCTI